MIWISAIRRSANRFGETRKRLYPVKCIQKWTQTATISHIQLVYKPVPPLVSSRLFKLWREDSLLINMVRGFLPLTYEDKTHVLWIAGHDSLFVERCTKLIFQWKMDMTLFPLRVGQDSLNVERWIWIPFRWEVNMTHLLLRDAYDSVPIERWTWLRFRWEMNMTSLHIESWKTPFLDIFSCVIQWILDQHSSIWSWSVYHYKSFIILFGPLFCPILL